MDTIMTSKPLLEFQQTFIMRRRYFDPSKKQDLRDFKYFKENGKWLNGCPFILEEPYLEIPAMCEAKFSSYMLSKVK
jgi:hypothetical protein